MFLTRQNVLVSVLVFVLGSLALFAAVEKFTLLLLQSLDEREKHFEPSVCLHKMVQLVHKKEERQKSSPRILPRIPV